MESESVECKMKLLPIHWPEGSAQKLFSSLVGSGKLFPAERWGDELENPLPDGPQIHKFLLEKFFSNNKNNEIKLGKTAEKTFEWKFAVYRDELEQEEPVLWMNKVSINVPVDLARPVGYTDDILDSSYACKSYLVSFDYRVPGRKIISNLYNEKMLRSVRSKVHKISSPGDWRGLSCVPWRLALGDYYTDMFGEERLQQLPRELGYRHSSGYWILQTCENPEDSFDGEARSNEQRIIDILGQEFFFNKKTGELPQVVPAFPPELIPSDQALIDEYGPMLAD